MAGGSAPTYFKIDNEVWTSNMLQFILEQQGYKISLAGARSRLQNWQDGKYTRKQALTPGPLPTGGASGKAGKKRPGNAEWDAISGSVESEKPMKTPDPTKYDNMFCRDKEQVRKQVEAAQKREDSKKGRRKATYEDYY